LGTNDTSVAPADLAAGNSQGSSTGDGADDGLDAPSGVIDLMIGAADAIAESLRRSSSRPLLEEHVDRVFAAIDEHLGPWLAAVCDQVADAQAKQLWDAVVMPLQGCASQISSTLWAWLEWLPKCNMPQNATKTPDCESAAPVATAESSVSLDPWLAAVALAGLVGREWISPALDSAAAEKIPASRARSRRSARPST
jgi:hypothetical protein